MKMHKNPVWLFFLAIILLITGFYTYKAGIKLYRHLNLSSETEVAATAWSIKTEGEDKFVPLGKYTFEVRGKFYNGETLFYDETTHNPWAAEESLKPLAAKIHRVWYAPKDPSNSSLQKNFPLKECIYAGALWALTIYFLGLGAYVAKMEP